VPALAALLACLVASSQSAPAQALPSPAPTSAAEQNAAIVRPLVEIGRIRARSPYCAALARARPAIDAAITFEYALPSMAQELRRFRLDSELTKAQSLDKLERDLHALADLAQLGRAEGQALRDAANAEGDENKRREMIAFADALNGAKDRQATLTRAISNLFGQLAETPVRVQANGPADEHATSALRRGRAAGPAAIPTPSPSVLMKPVSYTATQAEAVTDHDRLEQMFSAFAPEDRIREDLKVAARHGTAAMQLGGCSAL
jgi:hypothetical protein